MAVVSVVRFSAGRPQPWANGRGTTVELLRLPEAGEWALRISVATIERDAPFSPLPGIGRVLIPLRPLTLRVDGTDRALEPFAPFAFSGGSAVSAVGVRTPLHVVNVMRRGSTPAEVEVLDDAAVAVEGVAVALEPAGVDGTRLDPLDAAVVRDGVRIGAGGRVAVVRWTPR